MAPTSWYTSKGFFPFTFSFPHYKPKLFSWVASHMKYTWNLILSSGYTLIFFFFFPSLTLLVWIYLLDMQTLASLICSGPLNLSVSDVILYIISFCFMTLNIPTFLRQMHISVSHAWPSPGDFHMCITTHSPFSFGYLIKLSNLLIPNLNP